MGQQETMKIVMIIGGTGTMGQRVLAKLLLDESIDQIRILSRGEHKQVECEKKFNDARISWLLGDIADRERVEIACRGVTELYHLAAIKHVHKAQYDPGQTVRTNVIGTMNVINACIRNKVLRAIFTSTDKAVDPINTYGASKLLAEQLWIAGNIGHHDTSFAAVRYGNVWGSQGSVIEQWAKDQTDICEVTDPDMTRFFIHPGDAASFIIKTMNHCGPGEVHIPKMKSLRIGELPDLFNKKSTIIGRRPGEKLHETLISSNEVHLTYVKDGNFIRYPEYKLFPIRIDDLAMPFTSITKTTSFNSFSADHFTPEEIIGLCNRP